MLLKLLLVAASALLSSLVAKRFGHAVGGTLAGLPMIAGPIMGFVLWATPVEGVRAIALATLVCLPATVAHLVTFAWSGTRWPWWLSLALANLAFFGLGMLMPQLGLPAWLVCLLALAVLALGGVAMPRLRIAPGAVDIPHAELACRVAAALLVAWAIIRSAGVAPAALSGLLLAVPITGNVLPCFTLPRYGAAATVALLRGFVRGLSGFGAFFVTLYLGLAAWPAGVAYAAAWIAALVVASALYALQRRHLAPAA
ncbi:MAG TPA: hypothetical protein PLG92_11685 [Piscinibacter sp.]|jgi:hypothetical protein|uniref:hypothetical protein n=1 Tax=Piscinibacter sp. TaxID=1903157 RepID=UPI0011DB9FF0|nr:hypothetical protein [Piscinibacter sp.]MBP5992020.1 hypothetical protein [Piscinibacter sp.]MBP6029557.1 hypothetical protein [Piscinibacter sp.]TXH54128.1 MAG: hypothetical protein E6Q93_18330 [Burkholderiaceae bacterium]HNK19022.1 hypothetical protein [Piscinibacter sp.]